MAMTFEQFMAMQPGRSNMERMPTYGGDGSGFTTMPIPPRMSPNYSQPGFGPGQGPPRDGAPGFINVPGQIPIPPRFYNPMPGGGNFSQPGFGPGQGPPRFNPTQPGFGPGQGPMQGPQQLPIPPSYFQPMPGGGNYSQPGFGPGQGPPRNEFTQPGFRSPAQPPTFSQPGFGPGQGPVRGGQRLSPVVNPMRNRFGSGNGPFR